MLFLIYIVLFLPTILINLLLLFKIKKYYKEKQTKSHIKDFFYCLILGIIYYSSIIIPFLILSSDISELMAIILFNLVIFLYLILTLIIIIFHFIYPPTLKGITLNEEEFNEMLNKKSNN